MEPLLSLSCATLKSRARALLALLHISYTYNSGYTSSKLVVSAVGMEWILCNVRSREIYLSFPAARWL
ncbi:uncharacterized protein LAJ45_00505 [Morchella importuna]|uniref:uncharacterized protein n=1 Tax=Morchella importuna TaxID=1174673 RepID=UPI001E8CEB87|nr:uncharacterized protein LAJ45_00505 [Morchella importuna]KAH8155495.1 hypothetical protein LAJ45_00505 [Morchella importuna]